MIKGNIKTLTWDIPENTLQITTIDGTVYTITNPKLSSIQNDDAPPGIQSDSIDDQDRELVAHLLEEYYKNEPSKEDVQKVMFAKNRKILTGDSVIMEAMADVTTKRLKEKINEMIPLYISVT